ncbi:MULTISPECIES: ATP-binding protein [unclassified Aureispira]|uniref:nSTAND1 domain-containing NTPase n=1 Tax=unclassified Aureispira TaxID=2649989 RepID=UPI0006989BDF|nr:MULTISPECIES: ATP-binding protein [unclassified Aureispira]WMX13774.1 ATP-binding protein [Aureispira sp. CCB-E]
MATQVKSPFKFLDSYDKKDKAIFFGRTQETYELYDRIFETNLVLLYGASGTGKTSLINCGLGNQFESTDWHPIFIRRKDNIMESMKEEFQEHAIKKIDPSTSMIDQVRSLYLDYFKPIYLIFDQFEEIFILGDKEEQRIFFEMIYQLLEEDLQCKVLISMREEYIAYLSEFEEIIPYLFDNRLRVEKMNSKNLKDVIEGTTASFNIELKKTPGGKEISELIIEKLRDKNHEIDLANLQVYLDRLYQMAVEKNGPNAPIVFDEALIKETGNLEDVMSTFLDQQLDVLEKELAQKYKNAKKGAPLDILFELVTDNGTKHAIDLEQIKKRLKRSKNIEPAIIDYCVVRFKEMRILRELS